MSENGHEPFDIEGDGDTIRMWPETDAEREARESFYATAPRKGKTPPDAYIHTLRVDGTFSIEDKLENDDTVSVQIAGPDGTIIASAFARSRSVSGSRSPKTR